MKKFFLYFFVAVFLASAGLLGVFFYQINKPSGFNYVAEKQISLNKTAPAENPKKINEGVEGAGERKGISDLPSKITLEMPFISQAPLGVWDPLHEDACEEASILMLDKFLKKENAADLKAGDEEIKAMVAFEEARGYGLSITLDQLKTISEQHLGMKNLVVKKNISIEDIKKELASGRPVIVGAAGKLLGNPNFRNGGPVYHMLIVKGYDATGFITNDPGTRKGEDYHYAYSVLDNAIHDWNEQDISKGGKNLLTIE